MTNNHSNRYAVPEDENFEAGSDNTVLKNFLGVKSKDQMERIEEQELQRTELELLEIFDEGHRFNAQDLINIHELWLGDIYSFAGRYRTVNMSKDEFSFAPASRIADLMIE